MKHTQGEWEVGQKVDKKGRKELCWEVTCKTNIPTMRGVIATVGCKPNARLIASAPELLEACKEALKYIQGHNDLEEYHTPKIECLLEQAIAKAESKEDWQSREADQAALDDFNESDTRGDVDL